MNKTFWACISIVNLRSNRYKWREIKKYRGPQPPVIYDDNDIIISV